MAARTILSQFYCAPLFAFAGSRALFGRAVTRKTHSRVVTADDFSHFRRAAETPFKVAYKARSIICGRVHGSEWYGVDGTRRGDIVRDLRARTHNAPDTISNVPHDFA